MNLELRDLAVILMSNDYLVTADAIVLLEGDNDYRCQTAAKLHLDGFAPKIIFSGGATNHAYGSLPLDEVMPTLRKCGVLETSVIHESSSTNTKEQAIEVVRLARENQWKKLILVASHYHQYRAYLTFLRRIIDENSQIILMNAPARNLSWFGKSTWGVRYQQLIEEFSRIEQYSKQGDLATYEEVIEYQKWKEMTLGLN